MPSRRSVILAVALGGGWTALSALAQGRATEGAAPSPAATGQRTSHQRVGSGPRGIALLIPPRDGPFSRASESVLAGVTAAHARDGAGFRIDIFELDDQADQLALVYGYLQERSIELALGPITRGGANALLELGALQVPTLALNYPDGDLPVPPNLVFFGLGIEAESRQVAALAFGHALARAVNRAPRAAIVGVASPVARRSAAAFREAWLALGGTSRAPIEFEGPRPAQDLRAQLGTPAPDAVFLAMGPEQARSLRLSLGPRVVVYGNSLISSGGEATQVRLPELDGVRLLEMPWQIEPDNAAVMAYDRAPPGFNLEMQRLYALGIDGFRAARRLLEARDAFEIDGVTGRLIYDPSIAPRIERFALPAEYRNGVPVPIATI
jgi:uncharacterized protein